MAKTVANVPEVDFGTAPDRSRDGNGFAPTTEFGRRLLELHRRIVAAGNGPSTPEELDREIAERRGGVGVVAKGVGRGRVFGARLARRTVTAPPQTPRLRAEPQGRPLRG